MEVLQYSNGVNNGWNSGTLSRISSGTRPSVQTVSDVCLKRICSLDTSAFSALEVFETTALYKFTYLLNGYHETVNSDSHSNGLA